MTSTWKQCYSRAKQGDELALGQLLEPYRNYLRLLARTQFHSDLKSKLDPSDLVQETFLHAHNNFGLFQGTTERELAGWLRSILANRLVSLARFYQYSRKRNVQLEQRLNLTLDQSSAALERLLPAQGPSPSEQVEEREEAVLVANALEQLPKHYRDVLVLRHLEGLTFPEVARRMKRTLNSVEHLWVRALAKMRKIFEQKLEME